MKDYVCSLKTVTPLTVPVSSSYTLVPFGVADVSKDDWGMHNGEGLIIPKVPGWGTIHMMVQWAPGTAPEYMDQICRDPLGPLPDTTATDHRPPSLGMQCFTKSWGIDVFPNVPLGIRVRHGGSVPHTLTLAEFKLKID